MVSLSKTRLAGLLAAVVLTTLPALAQFQRGTIVGTVSDQSGAVVGKAQVMLKNLGTNEERSVNTDEHGEYTFASLLPGTYQVTRRSNRVQDSGH